MKIIKLFEEYHKDNKDSTILYRDNNLVVVVTRSYEETVKYSRDTNWCTTQKGPFEEHDITANLYRFHFKDGYKLRLTWDYLDYKGGHDADFSGGTHWGCGGKLNGEKVWYQYIRPVDESEPFYFDYNKGDDRQQMIDYIHKIPQKAINEVLKYQEENRNKSTDKYNNLYNEISKIVIKNITIEKEDTTSINLIVTVEYNKKMYDIKCFYYKERKYFYFLNNKLPIEYLNTKFSPFDKYLTDKVNNFIKKNNIKLV